MDITKVFDKWTKLSQMWDELAEHYYKFPREFQVELEENYNVDSGHSYADYIFAVGNIDY